MIFYDFLGWFHGIFMGFSWDVNGILMGVKRSLMGSNGIFMGF